MTERTTSGYTFRRNPDDTVSVYSGSHPLDTFRMPPRAKSLDDFIALWWTFYDFGRLKVAR